MDGDKSSLFEIYKNYHLKDDTASAKELQESQLSEQGRKFLCSQFVKPKDRFLYLNLDFYKSILLKIATCENFESQDGDGNVLNRLVDGFHNLEKYAINLWKYPWRKEYHSIKLYTAFFKCNVQKQLQDTGAILSILKSLGYKKTPEQDQVQVKDPDIARVQWVSLDLYLVQLDLLIIKEIMDNTNTSKLSLKHFVKARAKTSDINDACLLLFKRLKLEETLEEETSSQRRLKQRKIGQSNSTADITHVAVPGAVSNSKRFILSSATEATAMDIDETPTSVEGIKSVSATNAYNVHSNINPATFLCASDPDLYGADAQENRLRGDQDQFVAPHNTSDRTRHLSNFDVTNRMVDDTYGGESHSLSHLGTMTSSRLGRHEYLQNWKDMHGTRGDSPSNGVRPPTGDTRPVHSGIASAGRQWRGNSGSDRYARDIIRETGIPASQVSSASEATAMDTDKTPTSVEGIKSVSATNAYNVHSNINPATFLCVSDRDLYGADAPENHLHGDQDQFVAPHDTSHRTRHLSHFDVTNRMVDDTSGGGSHSVSYLGTMTSSLLEYSQNWKDLHGTRGDSPSNGVQPPTGDTRPVHPGIARAGRQWGGNSGSDRYTHSVVRETGSSASQQFRANELLRPNRRIDSVSRQKDSSLMEGESRIHPTEPMEVEQTESNRVKYVNSHSKRIAEGGHARSEALFVVSGQNLSQDLSPRSKEIVEGTVDRSSAHSSVLELDDTLQSQLSLKNGTPKEAAVRSSSAKDAISTRAGREINTGASVSNRPPTTASAGYDTTTDPADGRGHTLHRRQEKILSHNISVSARYVQDQGMSDQSLQKVSTRPGSDLVPGAEASLKKDRHFEGTASNRDGKDVGSLCIQCLAQGDLICKNCLEIICKQCEKIFDTNLCERSKDKHVFEKLKDEGVRKNTAGVGASTSSNQDLSSPGVEKWSCYQCTYLNSPEHRVCIMCGASRGGQVEQSKPGSSVCGFCTLHNDVGTKVCIACHKTLDRNETVV